MVERCVVSERRVGNIGNQYAVMTDAQPRFGLNRADNDAIQAPFFEDLENFLFAAFDGHQQHPFLALREHDFVRAHAGLALWH